MEEIGDGKVNKGLGFTEKKQNDFLSIIIKYKKNSLKSNSINKVIQHLLT